jgi:predicted aspartyl protease
MSFFLLNYDTINIKNRSYKMATTKKKVYHEPNDTYFREHLSAFVKEHGIIPLILHGSHKIRIRTEAFVDSGATFSIFNMDIAKSLKFNLKNAREQFFVVGDGSFIPAKVIRIPVEIGEEKIIADIAFSEKLNIGFNLPGRKGIFEYFDEIAFNDKGKEVIFRLK